MEKKTKTEETPVTKVDKKPTVKKFTKAQFVKSQRFSNRRDILNALLDENKEYSIAEVEDIIKDFLTGKKTKTDTKGE